MFSNVDVQHISSHNMGIGHTYSSDALSEAIDRFFAMQEKKNPMNYKTKPGGKWLDINLNIYSDNDDMGEFC